MAESPKRIVLVGHCGPDFYAIRSAVGNLVPDAEVVAANEERALQREAPAADLLLVNRVLDGDFPDEGGVALIRRLGRAGKPKIMLVSDYDSAQQQAVGAGALPGFGKSDLYGNATRQRILTALNLAPVTPTP
jgi:hypothetical protein